MTINKKRAFWIVVATYLAYAIQKTWAQDAVIELPTTEKIFILTPGVSKTVEVNRHFKTVTIADPNIVDAIARTDRIVYLVPKTRGVTNVTFVDDNEQQIVSVLVIVEASAFESRQELINLTLGMSTRAFSEQPFKTWRIADPHIVKAVRETDRSVVLEPLEDGATNIDFLDERGTRLSSLNVRVEAQADAASLTQVRVYNQKVLSGTTLYACTRTGCQLGKETIPKSQGLAGGRSEQKTDETIDQAIKNSTTQPSQAERPAV
jgi:Flp pilus assembly secretin CpaC